MKTEMEQLEIERVKEKVSNILQFWRYKIIEVSNGGGHKMMMSKDTFLKALEEELKR